MTKNLQNYDMDGFPPEYHFGQHYNPGGFLCPVDRQISAIKSWGGWPENADPTPSVGGYYVEECMRDLGYEEAPANLHFGRIANYCGEGNESLESFLIDMLSRRPHEE